MDNLAIVERLFANNQNELNHILLKQALINEDEEIVEWLLKNNDYREKAPEYYNLCCLNERLFTLLYKHIGFEGDRFLPLIHPFESIPPGVIDILIQDASNKGLCKLQNELILSIKNNNKYAIKRLCELNKGDFSYVDDLYTIVKIRDPEVLKLVLQFCDERFTINILEYIFAYAVDPDFTVDLQLDLIKIILISPRVHDITQSIYYDMYPMSNACKRGLDTQIIKLLLDTGFKVDEEAIEYSLEQPHILEFFEDECVNLTYCGIIPRILNKLSTMDKESEAYFKLLQSIKVLSRHNCDFDPDNKYIKRALSNQKSALK